MILSADVLRECAGRLSNKLFYVPAHQILFLTLSEFADEGVPVDFVTLKERLRTEGQLEEVGGPEALNSLFNFLPTGSNWEYYVKILTDFYVRRATIIQCNRLLDKMFSPVEPGPNGTEPIAQQLLRFLEQESLQLPRAYQAHGNSLSYYFNRQRDPGDAVLGNYYLERGCALFIYAQSGIGKSSLVIQCTACWACGKECIDLIPNGPLRIIVFQSEDTENDLSFQAKIIRALKLEVHLDLIARNTHIESLRGVQGSAAIAAMRDVLHARRRLSRGPTDSGTDLIIINPYSAYMDGDINRPQDNARFLYGLLQPLLIEFNCAAALPHHTPKTTNQNRESWSPYDYMYSGAGAATITNFSRAIITIEPDKKSQCGIFNFRAAKRFRESGWPFDLVNFRHSDDPDCPIWLPCSAAEATAARKKTDKDFADLRELLPVLGSIPKTMLAEKAKGAGFTQARFKALLDEALAPDTGDEFRLYQWFVQNAGPGRPVEHIARSAEPEEVKLARVEARFARQRENEAERQRRKRERDKAAEKETQEQASEPASFEPVKEDLSRD